MMLIIIVVAFIVAGLYILWALTRHRSVSSMPPFHQPLKSMSSQQHRHDESSEFPELLPSPTYTVPFSMPHLGDRSQEYAQLRKDIDQLYPYDPVRSLQAMHLLRKHDNFQPLQNPGYDIYNCPDKPPEDYPHEWSTLDLLGHWRPHDTSIPSQIYQGLCVFDYSRDYVKALRYRQAGLPFITRNDPAVAAAVERWNSPGYMQRMLRDVQHRAEFSENNHFMYWRPDATHKQKFHPGEKGSPPDDWKPPTKMIRISFEEWLKHANVTDASKLGPDQPHWYFRLIGCGETGPEGDCDIGSSEYLFDELTFFQPAQQQLYLAEPKRQKGIHCRFGMEGVIAENHFDSSRNAIVVLNGERRYILSHPKNCPNMALLPKGHPSARHSAVNWNDPDLDLFPQFAHATSNEVVLQPGDVLYLPTNWFHFIVSLSMNYQCNTRSGQEVDYMQYVADCGFAKNQQG